MGSGVSAQECQPFQNLDVGRDFEPGNLTAGRIAVELPFGKLGKFVGNQGIASLAWIFSRFGEG